MIFIRIRSNWYEKKENFLENVKQWKPQNLESGTIGGCSSIKEKFDLGIFNNTNEIRQQKTQVNILCVYTAGIVISVFEFFLMPEWNVLQATLHVL